MIVRRWSVVLGVLLLLLGLASVPADAAAPGSDFHIVHQHRQTIYRSVSCVRPGLCMAAGAPGTAVLVKGRWKELTGKIQKTMDARSVSCVSGGSCMVTGAEHSVQYTLHDDGTITHRVVDIPRVAGSSFGFYPGVSVDCVRADWCLAAGHADGRDTSTAVISTWNGEHWRSRRISSGHGDGDLEGQQVTCWEVGQCRISAFGIVRGPATVHAYVLRWSHGKVGITRPFGTAKESTDFPDIACTSATWCLALGGLSDRGLAHQHEELAVWNGTTWHRRPSNIPVHAPRPLEPSSLSCLSAGLCVATATTFSSHPKSGVAVWSHGSWSRRPMQSVPPPNSPSFEDITCVSTAYCLAVGSYGRRFTNAGLVEAGHIAS